MTFQFDPVNRPSPRALINWPLSSPDAIHRWLVLSTAWSRCLSRCGAVESIPIPSIFRFLTRPLADIDQRLSVLELLLMGNALRSLDPVAIRSIGHTGVHSAAGIRDRRWAIMTLQQLQGVHNAALLPCKTPEGRRLLLLEHCQHICTALFPAKAEADIDPLFKVMEELLETKQEVSSAQTSTSRIDSPKRVHLPANAWDSLIELSDQQHENNSKEPRDTLALSQDAYRQNAASSGIALKDDGISDAYLAADDALNDVQRLMV